LSPPPTPHADGAAELEGSLQGWDDDGGDTFGRAVAACLAQLAVTAGSDALWKPLNHQVLMMTRSLEPRTRLLALNTAAQVVERLAEEYLALLPETLPFLAELLEDPEQPVEAAAAALVRRLEALSGESLEQYLR
jgi:U3 small nucleolar RNA-associated protein 10